MDTGTLERALSALGLHARVRWDEVTGSTNQVAGAMAAEGAPEWSIAAAGHQTAGRGRLDRTWEDRAGRALMCSLVLRPVALSPRDAGLLSLMAGVALAQACRSVSEAPVLCKWPNDLLLGGAKVGGVLAESRVVHDRLDVVVVGTGVNLEAPQGVEGAAGIGPEVDVEALLTAYLRRLVDLYDPGNPGFPDAVRAAWRGLSATLGKQVRATTASGSRVDGAAIDVDPRGGLIIETAEGPVTVAHGEVTHLG
jgi:BirA family biotin operon repressor/biotin-[acetyl-CoA-carboxylase] ligase